MKSLTMNTHNRIGRTAIILALGTLAACGSRDGSGASPNVDSARAARAGTLKGATQNGPAAKASADSGMRTKMSGMPGMSGNAGGNAGGSTDGTMMDQMQTHLRMLDGASGDSLKAMMAMHRSEVANMISEANGQMRKMNMPAGTAWQATTDSLRQDLVRMPEMSASQLQAFMPGHRARIMRFMEMHRSMMSGMKPDMKM